MVKEAFAKSAADFHNFHKTFINGKSKSGQFFQFHLNVDFSRSVVHLNVDTLVHLDILTSILILFSTYYFRTNSKFKYLRAEVGVAGAAGQQSVLTVLSIWNCGNWLSPHMAVVIKRACWKNQNLS